MDATAAGASDRERRTDGDRSRGVVNRVEVALRGHMSSPAGVLAAVALCLGTSIAAAQDANSLNIELNKLEPIDKGCRAYVVIDNKSATEYEAIKLDLFMFRTDGVIGRRFAIDVAPLKGSKRTVKLFDLAGAICTEVGSFLINEVLECKAGGAQVPDCLARLAPSSRAEAKLSK